jgi:hypothetical protein
MRCPQRFAESPVPLAWCPGSTGDRSSIIAVAVVKVSELADRLEPLKEAADEHHEGGAGGD